MLMGDASTIILITVPNKNYTELNNQPRSNTILEQTQRCETGKMAI